jgi:anti-anti-sigma factor
MEGDRAVIRPTGNITAASAPELKQRLVDLIDAGVLRYSFDFDRVAEIDSMSLTVFVILVKMLMKMEGHGELEIVNCSDDIRKLFALTRLDSHYMIL